MEGLAFIMGFYDYYFVKTYFEDINTGVDFEARIEKNDRFYQYLLPLMIKGKAESMTPLKVDSLYIPKSVYPDICSKTYKMIANAVFRKKQNDGSYLCYKGVVTIDMVCVNNVNPMNIKAIDNNILINLCDMEIQYQSRVQYAIMTD